MPKISSSYRARIIYLIIGSVIAIASMVYTNYIAKELTKKEKYEIELWCRGYTMFDRFNPRSKIESELLVQIANNTTTIPAIMTDDFLNVIDAQNVSDDILNNPKKLRHTIEKMCGGGRTPIRLANFDGRTFTVYYGDSTLLRSVRYFPFVQLSLIAVFIGFAYMTFRSSKQNEQNRVWIGMAKETAHQLGTPTSSLLGWAEYLREQNPNIADEMTKDITRLTKVADRFGKIGSTTQLEPRFINDSVRATVDYFQARIPRNVTLTLEEEHHEHLRVMVNDSLFEWVIENLLKNALDALQGKGSVSVKIFTRDKWAVVDVIDSGKGIPKSQHKQIFKPGYSTKTRGWGLGLSLCRRIVEEYHDGKIFVKTSEVGKGSTFRVMVKLLEKPENNTLT